MVQSIGYLAGGIGLFLLGMTLMTDGLKLVAGPALHRILAGATRTRAHALGSGILVTALVQSSSATTIATIGFVNAGLLALGPALWVLFGANVGTTMTGWIVALIGVDLKIDSLAMPLVGVGALLRLSGENRRLGGSGSAAAGFGLLFMGISLLQQAFAGLAAQISLPAGEGVLGSLAQLGVGMLMTVLMQSSSAAMAITLTAAQGGLIGEQGAAAMVIGANIGTTATAMVAAVGATANARRAASAHVVFNLVTGGVALLLLPWITGALSQGSELLGWDADPAVSLALFHTTFNMLGVLLMWPLAGWLTAWLQRRFQAREQDAAQSQFLDDTVLPVPTLALDALSRELARVGALAERITRAALAGRDAAALRPEKAALDSLVCAIDRFVERLRAASMSQTASVELAALLRVERCYQEAAEQACLAADLPRLATSDIALARAWSAFEASLAEVLASSGAADDTEAFRVVAALGIIEERYEALSAELLAAGADGRLGLSTMEQLLRQGSALRRATQQLGKARRRPANAASAST